MPMRERPSQAVLRGHLAGSTHRLAYPGDRAPQWTSKAFLGEFGDAFVQATDLEGGQTYQSIPEYCDVVREALSAHLGTDALGLLQSSSDKHIVHKVLEKLEEAARVAHALNSCRGWDNERFDEFLAARSKQVEELAVGDFLLWCGGWSGVSGGHAIMYMVDKVSASQCDWITFNTGQGVGNHPDFPSGYPKQKRYTQMRLKSKTDRIADPAWLWIVFKIQAGGHKDHTPAMIYEVALPALVGDSLVRACREHGTIDDPFAVPETLQRSGVCYYRCILTAVRYSLRRLGFQQPQVKQFMHVVRRAFVSRVTEDLARCHEAASGRVGGDKSGVIGGLYPSQRRLVMLSAELLGYSAIKESEAGRLSPETLQAIVSEVNRVESLASTLPTIGAGENTNDWMKQEGDLKDDEADKNFPEASAASSSVMAFADGTLNRLAGGEVKPAPQVQVDFGCLPRDRESISDYASLKSTLTRLQGMCKLIRYDEGQRTNLKLLRVCSLLEFVFLELLPIPVWEDSCSLCVWHAPNLEEFCGMRDTLCWLANEYASACLSMPIAESTAVRILTHTAIAVASYECIRSGPLDSRNNPKNGAGVTAKFIRERKLGFPFKTRAGEDLINLTSKLVMDNPDVLRARSRLCQYITKMQSHCGTSASNNCFSFAHNDSWKFTEYSPSVKQTLELVSHLSSAISDFSNPGAIFDCVRGRRQKDSQLTDLQRALAWMIRKPGDHVYGFLKSLDTWLSLRDLVTGYVFAITAVPPSVVDRGAAKLYPHKSTGSLASESPEVACSTPKLRAKWDAMPGGSMISGLVWEPRPELNDKYDQGELKRELNDYPGKGWSSDKAALPHPLSLADPRHWISMPEKNSLINEDDILHTQILEDFDGNLSQEEAELLFSYLTAPYLRIPLVLEFFAKERVGCLFDKRLQDLLWHVLFCPGTWGKDETAVIETVPAPQACMFTDQGYFIAELIRGPKLSLEALMRILNDGIRLAVGDFESTFTPVLLYLVRVGVRALTFLRSISVEDAGDDNMIILKEFDSHLSVWLSRATELLQKWQTEAAKAQHKPAECAFHAHLAIQTWPLLDERSAGCNDDAAKRFLGSTAFVNTWNSIGDVEPSREDASASDTKSFLLGVSDQEVFTLIQKKMQLLQNFCRSQGNDELRELLEHAIRTTTGESELLWNGAPCDCVNKSSNSGTLFSFRDIDGMFVVDLQFMSVTYKSSTLQPVPDLIARHPDFYAYYRGKIPHCATLSHLSHRQQVFVPKGQKLLSYWKTTSAWVNGPGCPGPRGDGGNKAQTFSCRKHPYPDNDSQRETIKFGGKCDTIIIEWSDNTSTEAKYDVVTLSWTDIETGDRKEVSMSGKKVKSEWDGFEASLGEFRNMKIHPKYGRVSLKWESDGSGQDDKNFWGWQMTASAVPNLDGVPLVFAGITYGGSDDRIYRYGRSSPGDIPWLSEVIDPVLFSELAEPVKNNPSTFDWKEISDVKANELTYLLPSREDVQNSDGNRVTLLSQSANKSFWRLLVLNRVLATVDVYVIDFFGRRAFPKQVYASDARMSLASLFTSKDKKSVHPPTSATLFSAGDFLQSASGGHNVLIYDQSEKDSSGTRLLLQGGYLSGVIPGSLIEGFDFWENQGDGEYSTKVGSIEGRKTVKTRVNEKGDKVPFIDPFFNYSLEIQPSKPGKGGAKIARIDKDPATLKTTARRLVNLKEASQGSLRFEIVRLLTQVESLSHVLAWTKSVDDVSAAHSMDDTDLVPDLIELPRLRLRFRVALDASTNEMQLFVVDRGGTYVLNDRSHVNPSLTKGLPRCLLLSNQASSLEILVPNYPLLRPQVSTCPFSESCIANAGDIRWISACDARCFSFPVHPSNAFVTFKSVGATIYWAFCKFMHRQYADAFSAINSCATDMPLRWSEKVILGYFALGNDDKHPNAHACRLKLRLSLLHSPIKYWPICSDEKGGAAVSFGEGGDSNCTLVQEYKAYLTKRCHVSMTCRLSYLEEVRIIKQIVSTSGSASAVILTRANFLDKVITGEDRKMLIPHSPQAAESPKHPYEDQARYHHVTSFLLPHATACRVDFDERCCTEKKHDVLRFGDEYNGGSFQYSLETKAGSGKFGPWKPKGEQYIISGKDKSIWNRAILIRGHTVDAHFKSDGSSAFWGYRYTCRPATQEELESIGNGRAGDPSYPDMFMCAASPQNNGGEKWEKEVDKATGKSAIDKFEGFAKCEPEWFGSVQLDRSYTTKKMFYGGEVMKLLDASWGADGSGKTAGGYPFWTHLLQGRCQLTIGGKPNSSQKVLEMLLRIGTITGKTKNPDKAYILSVASVAALSKASMGKCRAINFDSLCSYNDPDFNESVNCYASTSRGAHPSTRKHVAHHLKAHGEILYDFYRNRSFPYEQPTKVNNVTLRTSQLRQELSGTVQISNYARSVHVCKPVSMGPASFSAEDFSAFMSQPLSSFVDFADYVSYVDKESEKVPSVLPFDLSGHPDAETVNAKATLKRITDDCEYYADKQNKKSAIVCVGITPQLMKDYENQQVAAGGPSRDISPRFAGEAKGKLAVLKSDLQNALRKESARLDAASAHLLFKANSIPGSSVEALQFMLLQKAQLQAVITIPHLVACLVSTRAVSDIHALNPYIVPSEIDNMLNATAGIVLVSNRISQLRRTIGCIDDVVKAINKCIDAKKMRKEIAGLIGNLLSKRHYGCSGDTASYIDPIDPRFLLFEYMTTFVLRKAQVYLVNTFMKRATEGGTNAHGEDTRSMVHQMIMGAGKTTIIGPLLALMLADGQSLVTQVVPNALLTMSRNVMWGRFCNVIVKPVFTLTFDRSWPSLASVYERLYEKMVLARQSGGIVVTTPSAIKSIVNKYIELLNTLAEAPIQRLTEQAETEGKNKNGKSRASARLTELQNCSDTADAIGRIMNLWSDREQGVLLMDEVDMLLHPLRSELNFPIGEKFPLTPSPSRWNLPIYLLDTVLQAATAAIIRRTPGNSTQTTQSADNLVRELEDALVDGFHSKRLQSVPHLVLLDVSFYEEKMRSLLVKRAISWMKAHHVFEEVDSVPNSNILEAYVLRGNLASESEVLSVICALPGSVVQVLNLAKDCTGSYLPHILAKVDRVSFGLLQPSDEEILHGKEQPLSRKLLGIPFVGKDVPSGAAEFAQPDVLISATILAYRYEGLRVKDLKSVVRLLKEAMQLESGPKPSRPAYALFEKWVNTACLRHGPSFRRTVMDLELFQLGDVKQMESLFNLLRMEPDVIHHYLRSIVFPSTMHQQRVKISASGQELGSNILFGRRLGFSGTPSNLLPVDIVPCHFEKGSEGRIIRSLTDDEITMEAPMSRALSENDDQEWSVKGVLDMIAQSTEYRALIDTGALITGYSNEEVARYLVDTGLQHLQGCVFLDHLDRKMIYLRGAARCIPLAECGIGRGERFTFYDQVHTTGMDIKQSLSACALLTIGKDMIFRDYAQGAYRMRGIGKGQTIHLFIVPEIKKLIKKTLPRVTGHIEDDVAAWLQLNNMKIEKLQFLQLCSQNMQTIWRKVAMNALLSSSGINGVDVVPGLLGSNNKFKGGMMRFQGDSNSVEGLKICIGALRDAVDFDVPTSVPPNEAYSETLQKMIDSNVDLVKTSKQKQVVQIVMKQVDDALKSSAARASSGAKKGLNSEMTREKEREQEQQKQKQQQQQQESMFAKDNSEPYSWAVDLLKKPPPESSTGTLDEARIFPFYSLCYFSPRPKDFSFRVPGQSELTTFPAVKPLAFPSSVMQSLNFAPLQRSDASKPLRLKNVSLILDWLPSIEHRSEKRFQVVLTLSEAESLRRLIQAKNKCESGGRNLTDSVAIAITLLPAGTILEATKNYPGFAQANRETKENLEVVSAEAACLKFANNNMYYNEQEISAILSAIGSSPIKTRQAFFDASIVARRRSRKSWTGTPLRAVFAFQGHEEYSSLLSLLENCKEKMETSQQDISEACDLADTDGNGFLSQQEIMSVFSSLQVPILPSQIAALTQLMDVDGDNAIDYAEFSKLFSPDVTPHDQLHLINTANNMRNESEEIDADRKRRRDEERRQRHYERMNERHRKEEAKEERRRQLRKAAAEKARRESIARERRQALEAERKRKREEQERHRQEQLSQESERRRAELSRIAREAREKQAKEREAREKGDSENESHEMTTEREALQAEEDRLVRERIARERRQREERWAREDQERRAREAREEGERRQQQEEEDREMREAEERRRRRLQNESQKSDDEGEEKSSLGDTRDINEGQRADNEGESKSKQTDTNKHVKQDSGTITSANGNVMTETIQSIDWGTIERRCDDKNSIAINGFNCCETRFLPFSELSDFAGCSGENQCCCIGFNFCCKLGAKKYERSRPQSIATPCCVCGQAENDFKSGRYCHSRAQVCCCIQNCCISSPSVEQPYRDFMYPQMAIFGYTFKPEDQKGFMKKVANADSPKQADMNRSENLAVVSEAGILLSQKGVDFGTIPRKCNDDGSILVNALGCFETRLLKMDATLSNLGCSGEHALGCIFCNYCCKKGADPYTKGRAQAIAFPCCLFGCIEPEFRQGRFCQWRFQCCCCLQSCCCVMGKDKSYPGYAYPQVAVGGYSVKPTKGCCKMLGENSDGVAVEDQNGGIGAPIAIEMER